MVQFVAAPVRVRAPATSANLGSGFDALGLALHLHDEVRARVTAGGVEVTVTGAGAGELPTDGTHLVVRCMMATFDRLGGRPAGLEVFCHNRIPQARGLGSSSAAIVCGILAARALVVGGPAILDDLAVLRLACELEGHPDNVAPCLLGGFTIAWIEPAALDGTSINCAGARAVRLDVADGVHPTIFVPAERGLTEVARLALPASVPHPDAAHAAGRSALLVHALTKAPELLFPATEDRLHQNYRAAGMPGTAALLSDLRARGISAVVSGAGPAVLVLSTQGEIPVTSGWEMFSLDLDTQGASVEVDLQHAERDPVAAGRAS